MAGIDTTTDRLYRSCRLCHCELNVNTHWWWHIDWCDAFHDLDCASNPKRDFTNEISCCRQWRWLPRKWHRRDSGISWSRKGDQLEHVWLEKYFLDASRFARCDMLGLHLAVPSPKEVRLPTVNVPEVLVGDRPYWFWFVHGRNDLSFACAGLGQCLQLVGRSRRCPAVYWSCIFACLQCIWYVL